jgi:hypothetical protein
VIDTATGYFISFTVGFLSCIVLFESLGIESDMVLIERGIKEYTKKGVLIWVEEK